MANTITPERVKKVATAREYWVGRLIDQTRRNRLLYYRDLKTGTLDLSSAEPDALQQLIQGRSIPLLKLLPDADEEITAAKAQEIRRTALSNLEERGLDTLLVAFGFATWAAQDGGKPTQAAVLLAHAQLEKRGREGRSITLKLNGEFQINPVLVFTLEREQGLKIDPESLMAPTNTDDESVDPQTTYVNLQRIASNVKGFQVVPRTILGNFAFQKMAMVKDLQENSAGLTNHDLIAAIAGDGAARELVNSGEPVDPTTLDEELPDQEFLVLDADSSQQAAIRSAVSLRDGVIHGPPGTGKSQTIANLIAEMAARGRRVLFVAEKRAALEVVRDRLQRLGLGNLALDLHGTGITRRDVMQRFAESLEAVRGTVAVDSAATHKPFVERRSRLNQHVSRLHAARAPSGLSAYQLLGKLLAYNQEELSKVRWRGPALDRLTPEVAGEARDLLAELGTLVDLFLNTDSSPWARASIVSGEDAQLACDIVRTLSADQLRDFAALLRGITTETGLPFPKYLAETKLLLEALNAINEIARLFQPEVFREDLVSLQSALAPARSRASHLWASLFNVKYRAALRKARELRQDPKAKPAHLLSELGLAIQRLEAWRSVAPPSAIPVVCDTSQVERCLSDTSEMVRNLGRFIGEDLTELPLAALRDLATKLAADTDTPYRLPRLLHVKSHLSELGIGPFLDELERHKPDASSWQKAFDYAWLTSCLDRIRADDPLLSVFDGQLHGKFVEEFRILDKERLKLAIARVRRAHAEQAIVAMNSFPEQATLVRGESQKKKRHIPLRKLFEMAPEVLTALRPCWLMSPLSVSELLPAARQYFDVVFFDEASQVLPEDAIPALLRAKKAVVAGDHHQLPPTTFFTVGDDSEDEAEDPTAAEGFQSLLEQMLGFMNPWSLQWHYRSLDESLIAFSNRYIYHDSLVTFPGVGGPPSLSHILVPAVAGQDGQEESSSEEVRRVVELVLRHAKERPQETLGVIAMGIKHAMRVQAAIDAAVKSNPALEEFFDESRKERFFAKNLERVQGDERDAIILTVGYGKDRAGKLPYRFGPLLVEGGERRLNVAITRARRRMTVVSSFNHLDMDPKRSKARGVELLRLFLEYAASRGKRLGDAGQAPFPLNTVEADVFDALTAKGIPLIPQYGISAYRIDFVAQHPDRPGRFVLAIEFDGASYHSAQTARDRDRLRQQHLEALGFSFHRIWSTDWFFHREKEIARTLEAYAKAVKRANELDSGNPSQLAPAVLVSADMIADPPAALPKPREARPQVPVKPDIKDYRKNELLSLVMWINSDDRLRTDDDIIDEMVKELGFQKRGVRIEGAVRDAIYRFRAIVQNGTI